LNFFNWKIGAISEHFNFHRYGQLGNFPQRFEKLNLD
jgi:hypothetical protein